MYEQSEERKITMNKSRFFAKILSVFLCAGLFVPLFGETSAMVLHARAEQEAQYEELPLPDENRDEELDDFVEPEYTPAFSLPENMRGVCLTPGVDFGAPNYDGTEKTPEELTAEAESVMDSVSSNQLNTVIIRTDDGENSFYSTDINETVNRTVIEYAIEAAKNRGFYVYLVYDINFALNELSDMELQDRIDYLALRAHAFTVKYPVDGIILDGYYSSKSGMSYDDYMKNGSSIGFDNWLLDNGAYVFSLVSDAIRKTNNRIPVGISIRDVWANYTTEENGSLTAESFQSLTDGYADTLSYIKKGAADFIFLREKGSLTDSSAPFEEILRWWSEPAEEAGIPIYVNHINEQICTSSEGWASPDELVKQVIKTDDYPACKGNVFNSLDSLEANIGSSTTVLVKHFNDQIDIEGLNSELEMTLPKSTTFTTEEPTVTFAGSFDPNFPIFFQDKPVKLNEAGRFYYVLDLDVGVNTFKWQSKAKVITYTITRTVQVLKDIEPSDSTMYIEEQSTVNISAIAYKGSTVTASINGKSITLKPQEGLSDELDPNSNYVKYVGTYTAPKGQVGKDIDLGHVVIYASYPTKTQTFTESRTGSKIIVNALPEIQNDYEGNILQVKNNNTMVYPYKTTNSDAAPSMSRLPAGTLDYLIKSVTYGKTEYYLTNSGKRLKKSDVYVLANEPLGSNRLSVASIAKDGTDTVIKFNIDKKTPFNISYTNLSYESGGNGDFYVNSFKVPSISITFDYITSLGTGDLTFPDTSMFSRGIWDSYESGGMTKYRLTLQLRQAGIYAGVKPSYNNEGQLVFRFNGYESGVKGATIVIDPGHGYTGRSAFDPGAVGHVVEQEVNLAVAKLVEQKLTAAGANVIRYHTESETYPTEDRSSTARQYSPDLFIAIHCNSAGESAFGTEAYYFTPFSQPLAKAVADSLGSYLTNNVNGAQSNRGAKYNVFWVTLQQEFPSILLETGFVTNYKEAMALANPTHQDGIATAIVNGIKNYFALNGYNPYGSGTGSADGAALPDNGISSDDMVTTEPSKEEQTESAESTETTETPSETQLPPDDDTGAFDTESTETTSPFDNELDMDSWFQSILEEQY